jgi:uncharacterized RDD family membrane protein YckC
MRFESRSEKANFGHAGRLWRPALVGLLALVAGPNAVADQLPGAGGFSGAAAQLGEGRDDRASHAWMAVPGGTAVAAVIHLPPRGAGGEPGAWRPGSADGTVRPAATDLTEMPEAMAAWGGRVYMVFSPPADQSVSLRPVRSVTVKRSTLGGDVWSYDSQESGGRLAAPPALVGDGALAGFVGSPWGPVALLRGREGADGSTGAFTLRVLAGAEWRGVNLPPASAAGRAPGVGEGGSDAARVGLVAMRDGVGLLAAGATGEGGVWIGREPDAGGMNAASNTGVVLKWTWRPLSLPALAGAQAGQRETVLQVAGNLISVARGRDGTVRIRGIEPGSNAAGGVLEIATIEGVPAEYSVAALDDVGRVAVLWSEPVKPKRSGGGVLGSTEPRPSEFERQIREVSVYTGRVMYAGVAAVNNPVSAAQFRLLALALVGLMAVVLVVVIRPDTEGSVVMPEGVSLADPGRRILAAGLDLFPALILAGRIFEYPLGDLLTPIGLMGGGTSWWVILTALGIVVLHCTLCEWRFGRSIGKFITGCAVVNVRRRSGAVGVAGDQRLRLWQAAARNLVKWLLPPVAALGVVSAERRHRGDTLAGTAVVEPIPDQGEAEGPGA